MKIDFYVRSKSGIFYYLKQKLQSHLLLKIKKQKRSTKRSLFFSDGPKNGEHYIGYSESEDEKCYWAGLCDIENGTEFKTARELFEENL